MAGSFPSGFNGPYDWAQALAERRISLLPGPLNTTLNPGRIGDAYASANSNCNTQGGDWRLCKRYRQFQATPAAGTAGGIGYGETYLNTIYTVSASLYTATGGTFTITVGGQTTAGIARNASMATIRAAIEAISTVDPGDVIVNGLSIDTGPFTLEFTGQYANQSVTITVSGAGLTGPDSPYTLTATRSVNGGSYEEYVAVQNNALYSIAASELSNADGSLATAWSTLTDPGISAGAWGFWTHGKYIFWATEQSSQKVYYKTIGLNDAKVLREFVGQDEDAVVAVAIPPYDDWPGISGTDVVTGSAVAAGTMNSETIDASGNVVLNVSGPTSRRTDVLVTFDIQYDATNRPDLNNNDYLGLLLTATYPFEITQVQDVRIERDGGTAVTLPIRVDLTRDEVRIWCDLTGVPYASRDAVEALNVRLRVTMRPGMGTMRLCPPKIGGVFIEGGTDIKNPSPSRPDTFWGYRYYRNSTTYSDFRKLSMDKGSALGERWTANLPHMGAHAALTIPNTSSFGFGVTDRIQLFRRSRLPANREPGSPPAWFLVNDAANSADMTYTDDMSLSRIEAEKQNYGDVDVPGNVTSVTSREVSGVTCGVSWKGSNIFFKTNGRAYGSTSNRPFEVLWDGVSFEIDPDAPGKARTLAIADNGLPVIAAVSQDDLFMFTRKEGWAMSGETWGTAGFPQRIDGVRGCIGRYGAAKVADGAMVASDSGLWYVKRVRRTVSSAEGFDTSELTQNNRPDWTTLLGTTPENTVVVESSGDIWCFNGNRFLHSPKPLEDVERFWIPGTWANSNSVQNAWGDPRRGVVVQFTDGTAGLAGTYLTDGGTNSAGDNGTAPTWSWTSKRFNIPASILKCRAYFEKGATSNLRVRLNCERMASSVAAATLTFDDTDGVEVKSWDRLSAGYSSGSNRWWEIAMLGNAGDVFNYVEPEISPGSWGP